MVTLGWPWPLFHQGRIWSLGNLNVKGETLYFPKTMIAFDVKVDTTWTSVKAKVEGHSLNKLANQQTCKWSITCCWQCFQVTFPLKPHDRLDPISYVPSMNWDFMFWFHEDHLSTYICRLLYGSINTYNWGKNKNLVTDQLSDFKSIWQKWSLSQTLPRLFKPFCSLKSLAPWSGASLSCISI